MPNWKFLSSSLHSSNPMYEGIFIFSCKEKKVEVDLVYGSNPITLYVTLSGYDIRKQKYCFFKKLNFSIRVYIQYNFVLDSGG